MLEKINIENFLSIESNQELKVSNKITTLIGGNAVGKSSILKAINKLNGLKTTVDEKNKNKKESITCISAKFRLTKKNRKYLNKKYLEQGSQLLFSYPENDTDIICVVSVNDDGALSYSFKLDNKDGSEFDLLEYNLDKAFDKIRKIIDSKKISDINLKDKLLGKLSSIENLLGIISDLNEDEKQILTLESISAIEETVSEIREKKYLALMPKYKFIYLNSFKGLLVDEIDFSEAAKNNTVKNFLDIVGVNIDNIINAADSDDGREMLNIQNEVIKVATEEFKKTFKQADIDDDFQIQMSIDSKNGKISFWIKNKITKNKVIRFSEESEGMQWYLSMYILLHEYFEKDKDDSNSTFYFLLLDEPNIYLHATAQIDLLNNIFKKKLSDIQIIFTTHSPYMIDANDLFSLRIIHKDQQTEIFNTTIEYLKKVNGRIKDVDVLSPVLLATGLNISNQLVISNEDRIVVVEGPHDHYMMSAMSDILKRKKKYKFIPCTGASKVPFMCGYLYGIGYSVVALVDDDLDGENCKKELSFENENYEMLSVIMYNKKTDTGYKGCLLEDLFSVNDKKNYMEKKNTPNYRNIYDNRKSIIFEEETLKNFKNIFDQLDKL